MASKRPPEMETPTHGQLAKRRKIANVVGARQLLSEWCPFVPELCPFHLEHSGELGIKETSSFQFEESLKAAPPLQDLASDYSSDPTLSNEPISFLAVKTGHSRSTKMSTPIHDDNPTVDPKLLHRRESVLQQNFRPLETHIPTTQATNFPVIHIQKATDTTVNQPLKEPLASLLPTEVATADKNHTINTPRSGAQIDRASSTEQLTTNSDVIQQSESPPAFTPAAEPPATHSHGDNTSDQMPFSCDVCGQKFKLKSSKTRHERNFHATGGSTRFGCPVCGKKYSRNDGLLAHARKDHGVELPHISRMTHSHTAAVTLSVSVEHDRNEPNRLRPEKNDHQV
ncbi:hypothetical protein HDK77DRAFT_431215 [Phyllosticta capitalensis]